jgi:transposase
MFPFIELIFVDGGYHGPATTAAGRALGPWHIEIIKRTDMRRFVVLPKRWLVERTFAWMGRDRRLSKDYENTTRFVTTHLRLAMILLMLRRLIREKHSSA